jgi:hypothetical protein
LASGFIVVISFSRLPVQSADEGRKSDRLRGETLHEQEDCA